MNKENNKPIIIVAEDDDINFLLIEVILKDYNLEILHTIDGEQTVKICKENENIDLILMDIRLPEMNGYEAAIKIKEFRKELPMIAQSAYALDDEIKQYGEVFEEYITKPISKNELLKKINKYVKLNR